MTTLSTSKVVEASPVCVKKWGGNTLGTEVAVKAGHMKKEEVEEEEEEEEHPPSGSDF